MKKNFESLFLAAIVGAIALATTACTTSSNMVIVENISDDYVQNQERLAAIGNNSDKTIKTLTDVQETMAITNAQVGVARANAKRSNANGSGFLNLMFGWVADSWVGNLFGMGMGPQVSPATQLPVAPAPQFKANINFGKSTATVSSGGSSGSSNGVSTSTSGSSRSTKADGSIMSKTIGNTPGHVTADGKLDETCFPHAVSTEPSAVKMMQSDHPNTSDSLQKKFNDMYTVVKKKYSNMYYAIVKKVLEKQMV